MSVLFIDLSFLPCCRSCFAKFPGSPYDVSFTLRKDFIAGFAGLRYGLYYFRSQHAQSGSGAGGAHPARGSGGFYCVPGSLVGPVFRRLTGPEANASFPAISHKKAVQKF
ncbi:hypothetical protein GCM10022408_15840 [Hymenobacter fastidiosus]|uniref:Uncharacterized protein n=1 Tax=Hymenobacter fastidiosus TaxID=486264 RepID=A0ABP7S0F5_9BACT